MPSTRKSGRSSTSRPLVVTASDRLLDDVLAAAAVGRVVCDVAHDAVGAADGWASASVVVVGSDAVASVEASGLPRRTQVIVVMAEAVEEPVQTLASLWQAAVALGADDVLVLPADADALVAFLSRPAHAPHVRGCVVVGVIGGRGGAGASVTAAALAITAARRGAYALLVDGDPLGGGLDLVVGGEDQPGMRWPDLRRAEGRVDASALHGALPAVDKLVVLSWDRGDLLQISSEAVRALLDAARETYDVVVIDLARHVDAAMECALAATALTLLVVPAEVRATAAAARVAGAIRALAEDLRVVVRGPAPGGLAARDIAEALDLPLAGDLRAEPGLAAALERGEAPGASGRGPLAEFATALLDELQVPTRVAA